MVSLFTLGTLIKIFLPAISVIITFYFILQQIVFLVYYSPRASYNVVPVVIAISLCGGFGSVVMQIMSIRETFIMMKSDRVVAPVNNQRKQTEQQHQMHQMQRQQQILQEQQQQQRLEPVSVCVLAAYLCSFLLLEVVGVGSCDDYPPQHVLLEYCNPHEASHGLPLEAVAAVTLLPLVQLMSLPQSVRTVWLASAVVAVSWCALALCSIAVSPLALLPLLLMYGGTGVSVVLSLLESIFFAAKNGPSPDQDIACCRDTEMRLMPLMSFMSGIDLIDIVTQNLMSHGNPTGEYLSHFRSMQECITNIRNTSSFMIMTINRCIDYSKATTGVRLTPHNESVELREALYTPFHIISNLQDRIAVSIRISTSLRPIRSHILTDKQWLQENLLCLLSNAIKYSAGGSADVLVRLVSKSELVPLAANESNHDKPGSVASSALNGIAKGIDTVVTNTSKSMLRRCWCCLLSCDAEGGARAARGDAAGEFFEEPDSEKSNLHSFRFDHSNSKLSSRGSRAKAELFQGDDGDDGSAKGSEHLSQRIFGTMREKHRNASRDFAAQAASRSKDADAIPRNKSNEIAAGAGVLVEQGQHEQDPNLIDSFARQHDAKAGDARSAEHVKHDGYDPSELNSESGLRSIDEEGAANDSLFILIEVQDTGIGLTEAAMNDLFKPFKQAQRMAGGTGLGLFSLAKRLEAQGGLYGVRRRADGESGSVFWFGLPYRPEVMIGRGLASQRFEVKEKSAPMTLQVDANHKVSHKHMEAPSLPSLSVSVGSGKEVLHVLVVDDAPMILKVTSSMLKRAGHTVFTAENGAIALKMMLDRYEEGSYVEAKGSRARSAYDLVVMDLQMPVMDGLEAVRRLREEEARLSSARGFAIHQQVICCSANSDSETRQAAMAVGADVFVAKPFSLLSFKEIVAQITSGR